MDVDDTLLDIDDKELLRRHVANDPEAFGELFRRHRDRMWAVATRSVGGNRDLAADCVQDAFISAFRHAGNFRGDSAVTTWLHRITVNACIDRLRREKHVLRRAGDLSEIDLPVDGDAHASTEVALDVHAALARLPEAQRMALVLVDMHAVPVVEAAAILGVAVGTVKSRCFRGREALAAILRPPPSEGTHPPPESSHETEHLPSQPSLPTPSIPDELHP